MGTRYGWQDMIWLAYLPFSISFLAVSFPMPVFAPVMSAQEPLCMLAGKFNHRQQKHKAKTLIFPLADPIAVFSIPIKLQAGLFCLHLSA